MPFSRCRSCDAPVEWAIVKKSGHKMPLDLDSDPDGMVSIVGYTTSGDPIIEVGKLGSGTRRSHFATCPQAVAHRRHPNKVKAT